jgi:hypothetical protein
MEVSEETLRKFEDPTLALDVRTFNQVQAEILALPDGPARLADARQAQQQAISAAIHRIFLLSVCILGVTLLLGLLLKERPLRATVAPAESVDSTAEARPPAAAIAH